jgi:hypothetical protein
MAIKTGIPKPVFQVSKKWYRCRVTGLVNDTGDTLPPVEITAPGRSTAKLMAAMSVGGAWTDDTDVEILETVEVE